MNPWKWWGAAAGPLASASASALLVQPSRNNFVSRSPRCPLCILNLSSSSLTLFIQRLSDTGICLEQQVLLQGDAAPRRHSGSVWRLRAGGGSAPRGQGCHSAPRSAQDRASAVLRPRPVSPRRRPPGAESSKHENGRRFRHTEHGESTFQQGDGHSVPKHTRLLWCLALGGGHAQAGTGKTEPKPRSACS